MRQCPPHTLEFLPEAKARESPHRAGLVGSQSCAERGERVAAIVRLVDNADGGEDTQQTRKRGRVCAGDTGERCHILARLTQMVCETKYRRSVYNLGDPAAR